MARGSRAWASDTRRVGGYQVLPRGYNPLVATISTPDAAPVIAATQLRARNAGSARGRAFVGVALTSAGFTVTTPGRVERLNVSDLRAAQPVHDATTRLLVIQVAPERGNYRDDESTQLCAGTVGTGCHHKRGRQWWSRRRLASSVEHDPPPARRDDESGRPVPQRVHRTDAEECEARAACHVHPSASDQSRMTSARESSTRA
jgi:hypothetical protein